MNITCNLIAFLLLVPGSSSRLAERVAGEQATLSEQTPVTDQAFLSDEAGKSRSGDGQTAFKSKKAAKAAALAARLSISRGGLRPQAERIAHFVRRTEQIVVRTAVTGPFADYPDFAKRALERVAKDVRDYAIAGRESTSVVMTEVYAERLESGAKKLGDGGNEKLDRRVRVADIPQLLDAMPDSRLFKKVLISENANPEDDYVTQTYYPEGFISSMAMIDGELELYKAECNEYLCRDVLHEWSHQLRYEFWNDKLMKCFEDGVSLEKVEWNPSIYATRSNGEQWAVLGERILGSSGEEFLECCKKAPVRTALWVRALSKCLADVPAEQRSVDHDQYVERVRFVESKIVPKALKKLAQIRRESETEERRSQAAGILNYLKENDWQTLTRNVALIYCLERYAADAEARHQDKEA